MVVTSTSTVRAVYHFRWSGAGTNTRAGFETARWYVYESMWPVSEWSGWMTERDQIARASGHDTVLHPVYVLLILVQRVRHCLYCCYRLKSRRWYRFALLLCVVPFRIAATWTWGARCLWSREAASKHLEERRSRAWLEPRTTFMHAACPTGQKNTSAHLSRWRWWESLHRQYGRGHKGLSLAHQAS